MKERKISLHDIDTYISDRSGVVEKKNDFQWSQIKQEIL
jgi:hypothetical protein